MWESSQQECFWVCELGESLNFQSSYLKIQLHSAGVGGWSHSSCPGGVKAAWGSWAQRESAFLWKDWEAPGPGKTSVCPQDECPAPPSLWASSICGFIFEADGDCVACVCAMCTQEVSVLSAPACAFVSTREVCKTISSCGSLRVCILRVCVLWVPESLCIMYGCFRA